MKKEEIKFYASLPNVNVRFQPKAWADEGICIEYITDFREKTADLGLGEVLIFYTVQRRFSM